MFVAITPYSKVQSLCLSIITTYCIFFYCIQLFFFARPFIIQQVGPFVGRRGFESFDIAKISVSIQKDSYIISAGSSCPRHISNQLLARLSYHITHKMKIKPIHSHCQSEYPRLSPFFSLFILSFLFSLNKYILQSLIK